MNRQNVTEIGLANLLIRCECILGLGNKCTICPSHNYLNLTALSILFYITNHEYFEVSIYTRASNYESIISQYADLCQVENPIYFECIHIHRIAFWLDPQISTYPVPYSCQDLFSLQNIYRILLDLMTFVSTNPGPPIKK